MAATNNPAAGINLSSEKPKPKPPTWPTDPSESTPLRFCILSMFSQLFVIGHAGTLISECFAVHREALVYSAEKLRRGTEEECAQGRATGRT
ncbi:hypothetical protein FPOAC1_010426 [Fusarium poae]|uniref:hypothetical protein n=1 Tax=Fusarium poae TaxID=36050 RepID=UPI001CE85A0A|nr:hypothetical protein FPOAC1_010426 [Fusarium poae]KAG8665627.1 hypothetical protein FPOAC1_010426 [Fusarium poae]